MHLNFKAAVLESRLSADADKQDQKAIPKIPPLHF